MLIDGEGGAGSKRKATDADADATAAYLEAIEGEDGFYRDAKGRLRVNKKRTRPTKEGDEVAERLEDLDVGARPAKKKKARAEPERIGAEFKAKVRHVSPGLPCEQP
jgi:ribosomal RNA-processing protein 12